MRAVIQRVKEAKVLVEGCSLSEIKKGMLILLGVGREDTMEDVKYLANKIANIRIFEDREKRTNLSLKDVEGEIMLIPQFTLYANTKRGRRPDFIEAAESSLAQELFSELSRSLKEGGFKVEEGLFGERMEVSLINDGPFTIIIDSKRI